MFCWITEPLGNTGRVSGVGVVSSSFVLLGIKTHDPDKLEFGWSSSSLQTFVAFFDGAGASFSPFDYCLEKTVQELDSSF